MSTDLIIRWNKLINDEHVLAQFAAQLSNVLEKSLHLPLVLLLYIRYLSHVHRLILEILHYRMLGWLVLTN